MRRLWRPLSAIAALMLLPACAVKGDFGREQASPLADTLAWIRPATGGDAKKTKLNFQFTDEEQRLRDLARVLTAPTYDQDRWNDVIGKFDLGGQGERKPDRSVYADRLFKTAYRSQTARYNRLIEDIRNDVVQLDPFFSVANYVADMDSKREKSLSYISRLTPEERKSTLTRIAENRAVIQSVQRALAERAASYKIALERLVISAPSPVAVEAERSLALLQQRIGAYRA
jgi:uncharacterized protein YciW